MSDAVRQAHRPVFDPAFGSEAQARREAQTPREQRRRAANETQADEGQAGATGHRDRPGPAGRISPDEKLITLTEAMRHLPKVDGKKVSVCTLWRWCRKGLRGAFLKATPLRFGAAFHYGLELHRSGLSRDQAIETACYDHMTCPE